MIEPRTEAELAEAVAAAKGPLSIRGGGTRCAAVAGETLSVAGLSGVSLHEPGALTLVAGAGTPVEEIEAVLAAEGQRLPFEPMDPRGLMGTEGAPTIGGVIAANASGPRRVQVGAARDFLLGVRFVDGQGTVIKNGGRVMKNVTGYDLVKLMAGARGTLGVLSEVSLKVLPAPEAAATLSIAGLEIGAAVQAMSAALGSPYDVTGAAFTPGGTVDLRLEGFATSVAYRAGELLRLLEGFGSAEVEDDAARVAARWQAIRDVEGFGAAGEDIWRISVRPGDAPEVAARAGDVDLRFDWGGGLIWVAAPPGTDLRMRLGAIRGHATIVRAGEETRRRFGTFHPEPAPVAALSAGLRARFDPRGILNAGLMG